MKKATYRIVRFDGNFIIRIAIPVGSYGARDYRYFNGYDSPNEIRWAKNIEDVETKMSFDEASATLHNLFDCKGGIIP